VCAVAKPTRVPEAQEPSASGLDFQTYRNRVEPIFLKKRGKHARCYSCHSHSESLFDEADHRLFIGTREPGKLIVRDSDSGEVVANLAGVSLVDDVGYSRKQKRIYYAGSEFLDVYQQRDPDHYEQVGHVPTSFRAHTAIFSDELNRYYLGVPRPEGKGAEIRIYSVKPWVADTAKESANLPVVGARIREWIGW